MFRLFKKDDEQYNYFRAFKVIASQIVLATDLISRDFKNNPFDSLAEALCEIQIIRKSVDHQIKELLNYLYEDFLPPIERKNIIDLTHSLNAVLKNTTGLIIHLDMYQIKEIQSGMSQLIGVIVKLTHELPQLMIDLANFKHPQRIRVTLEKMNQFNIQGIELYKESVKNLYLGEMNVVDIMKYTKMYEHFNEVLESIEQLMNNIEAVIIENT